MDVDKFKNDDGSKLITASSTWRSLKSYVSKHSKVDMRTVDKAESMELFSMHVFVTNEPCLIYLKDITNKIVYACGRLLLSLEVMDIYLHGNQQLWIWEQTMYRLLWARYDGSGDEKIWNSLKISFDDLNLKVSKNI